MEVILDPEDPDPKLAPATAGFRSAVRHNIHEIMKSHPSLNSIGWKMILRAYGSRLFSKLVVSGTSFTSVAKTKFGSLKYRPFFVNEVLMAQGLYEPHVREIFKPEKGETVIDVGSNIGFYTLRASRRVGETGRVISLEPNRDTFSILKSNIASNHSGNILAICCAAGAEDGFADLYVPSNYPAGSTIIQNESDLEQVKTKVPVTTIDSLVRTLGIEKVDWIKIDVEGSEEDVIAGCLDVIRTYKPKIVIETGSKKILHYLRENGYCVEPLKAVIGFHYAYPT